MPPTASVGAARPARVACLTSSGDSGDGMGYGGGDSGQQREGEPRNAKPLFTVFSGILCSQTKCKGIYCVDQ